MKTCSKCGVSNPDLANFCEACGSSLAAVQPVEAAQPVYQQPAEPVAAAQPVYQQPVQPVAAAQPVYQQPAQPVAAAQPVYQQPAQPVYQQPVQPEYAGQPVYQQTASPEELDQLANSAMVTGIVGAALSELGVPGIIVSAIARSKHRQAVEAGATGGKMIAAKICSIIGLAVSITVTSLYSLWLLMMISLFF